MVDIQPESTYHTSLRTTFSPHEQHTWCLLRLQTPSWEPESTVAPVIPVRFMSHQGLDKGKKTARLGNSCYARNKQITYNSSAWKQQDKGVVSEASVIAQASQRKGRGSVQSLRDHKCNQQAVDSKPRNSLQKYMANL